jgi:hypothetical protein
MTFEQKIRKALPHLSARELWFIEIDYAMSKATMSHLGQCADARQDARMEKAVTKERMRRFPKSRCPFPRALHRGWSRRQSKEMDALYERIQRGTFAAPKDLNAGQRPGLVGCASTPPAGGARNSAFDLEGRSCAK